MDVRRVLKSVTVDARKMLRMFRALDREAIAAHVLSGTGIEIGGLRRRRERNMRHKRCNQRSKRGDPP